MQRKKKAAKDPGDGPAPAKVGAPKYVRFIRNFRGVGFSAKAGRVKTVEECGDFLEDILQMGYGVETDSPEEVAPRAAGASTDPQNHPEAGDPRYSGLRRGGGPQ